MDYRFYLLNYHYVLLTFYKRKECILRSRYFFSWCSILQFQETYELTGQQLLVLSTEKSPPAENYRKAIEGAAGSMVSYNFRYYSHFLINLYKNGNVRFTIVPLKAFSDQVWTRYPCFCFLKLFICISGFSAKVTYTFLTCN